MGCGWFLGQGNRGGLVLIFDSTEWNRNGTCKMWVFDKEACGLF